MYPVSRKVTVGHFQPLRNQESSYTKIFQIFQISGVPIPSGVKENETRGYVCTKRAVARPINCVRIKLTETQLRRISGIEYLESNPWTYQSFKKGFGSVRVCFFTSLNQQSYLRAKFSKMTERTPCSRSVPLLWRYYY